MLVSAIISDIRRNIQDNGTTQKYDTASDLIPAISRILDDMWVRHRMAFCEREVRTLKPASPTGTGDTLPVSDGHIDTLINGVSAYMLRFNSSDPSTIRSADRFESLYQQALPS
ncbi:MAG: hypothetical protein JW713_05850 [Pontiellaceae bacterium]|nr:hypothetical protein [Pontiellaceae bacterium]